MSGYFHNEIDDDCWRDFADQLNRRQQMEDNFSMWILA